MDSALSSSRTSDSYSWLLQDRPHPGAYVPQLGDALVYIPQGHAHHLESRNNKFAAKPWRGCTSGSQLPHSLNAPGFNP